MTLLWSVFRDTLRTYCRRPLAYTLVQWPMVVLLFLGDWITPNQVNRMADLLLPILVYLPLMVACLALGAAGTWFVHQGADPRTALPRAFTHLRQLYLPNFFATIWILVGLPIILPGIYFSALFLFVPYLVLIEPGARPFSYLHRSRLLAAQRLGVSLFIATAILLVDLAEMGVGESLSVGVASWTGLPLLGYTVEGLLAAIVAANVNIGVVLYFHQLREAS